MVPSSFWCLFLSKSDHGSWTYDSFYSFDLLLRAVAMCSVQRLVARTCGTAHHLSFLASLCFCVSPARLGCLQQRQFGLCPAVCQRLRALGIHNNTTCCSSPKCKKKRPYRAGRKHSQHRPDSCDLGLVSATASFVLDSSPFPHRACTHLDNLIVIPLQRTDQPNQLCLCQFNAKSVGQSRKRTAITDFIVDHDVDIMFITETWLRESGDESKCADLTPPGYKLFSFPRQVGPTAKRGGGIAVIVKDHLASLGCVTNDFSFPHRSPWFIKHFSRDRFQLLLKFLHFADNNNMPDQNHPNYKLYKIQPVIDHFREKFLHYYQPHWDISIDENMIGYKGKTPHLRMFMPNKRHALFGIKLWCLFDSTNGYLCRFEVCKGAHNPRDPENVHGATYALVMRLMRDSGFLNKGYHLCLDNYFSSPLLFQTLHVQQTTATGTVRTHRRGLPRDCITRRLRNGEVSERRKGPLLCVAYKDGNRKPVLLSTAATTGYSEHQNRRGNRVQKSNTVLLYNRAMGGVDLGDAQLYMYLAERRTMKWTTKVAFSLFIANFKVLGMTRSGFEPTTSRSRGGRLTTRPTVPVFSRFGRAILNSYLLYKMNTSDAPVLSRYLFMVSVVESLASNYYPPQKVVRRRRTAAEIRAARDNPQPQLVAAAPQAVPAHPLEGHALVKLPVGRKRNCVTGHGTCVRSGWECPGCDVGLCPGCFAAHHKRPRN
ncbi:piggyBac transposable element-derived protein 4-like [Littorina saxatilis]|uniref:piggyBac transposable element-derived protein 4-like n=1 Tax=Littorina saxatilis TaxID=31220 RepID=UPI0038B4521C